MRPKLIKIAKILAAALVVIAAGVGGWSYFHSRVIRVWLFTDSAFRFQHENWPTLIAERFKEVNRIYSENGTRVQWQLLDSSKTDPTSDVPGIDNRRATMIFHQDQKTDIYMILTGVREGDRTGSVSPFTNVAVIVDYPDKSESINARLMAHELAHLFGAPHDPAWLNTLMGDKPESNTFSDRTAALIRQMRNYPFEKGIDGLAQDSWEKKALAALADDDTDPHANPTVHAQTVVGTALLNERKKDRALVHFKAAVNADPQNIDARLNLAEAYTRDGDDNLALEQAREIAKLAPDSALSHRALGAMLGRTHQPDAAVDELKIAARMEPNNPETQLLLGTQFATMFGHMDDAIACMREAVRLSPDSTKARATLEKMLILKDQVAAELVKQRVVVAQNPNDAEAHYQLAKSEALTGDLNGAIRDFQKCAELRPGSGTTHAEIAEILLIKGDTAGALAEVRKARALGAEPPPALLSRLPAEK